MRTSHKFNPQHTKIPHSHTHTLLGVLYLMRRSDYLTVYKGDVTIATTTLLVKSVFTLIRVFAGRSNCLLDRFFIVDGIAVGWGVVSLLVTYFYVIVRDT